MLSSFLVLSLISASEAASCSPVSGSTCKCTLSDGATGTVDLSPLFGSPLQVTAGGQKYVVDACNAVASTCKNCGSGTADPCAGCQDARGMGGFPPAIHVLSTSPLTLNFSYSNGYDGRTFNIVFKYNSNRDGQLMFTKEEPPLHYQLEVDSNCVSTSGCSGGGGGGASGGPNLDNVFGGIIIGLFCVGVIAYIVIGIIVNYKVKGARGVEMIPNWSFWKDMPFLLKDGFLFTFTYPCKKCGLCQGGYDKGVYNKL